MRLQTGKRKIERQKEAEARRVRGVSRTVTERLARLDESGFTATKERAKLTN